MTIPRLPIAMGLMMGLMLPWMMHMESASGVGLAFVLAHVAFIAGIGATAFILPAVRHRAKVLLAHRPKVRHLPYMAIGLTIGWVATCALCLVIGGQHWT